MRGGSILVLAACLGPVAASGRNTGVQAHLRNVDPKKKDKSGEDYTLIQYIQSSTCMGERFVCQPLKLDQITNVVHRGKKVCSKVYKPEGGAANSFEVDTCPGQADTCPDKCECEEKWQYNLDECMHGQNLAANVAVSWKLVKGTKEGCVASNMDTGLARWCSKWPSKGGKKAAKEEDEEEADLLQAHQHVKHSDPKLLASPSYDTNSPHSEDIPGSGTSIQGAARSGGIVAHRYASSVVALFALLAVAYTR